MSIEGVLMILLYIVVIFVVAWLAQYIIQTFFPEQIRMPAMLLVGALLLIAVILLILRGGSLRVGDGPANPTRHTSFAFNAGADALSARR